MRDTFVTTTGKKLEELEPGSIVGTSSLRRELLIKEINPYVTIKLLRGNVQTRLSKLRDGQYDGIILAAAGIERLGYEKEEGLHYQYLDRMYFFGRRSGNPCSRKPRRRCGDGRNPCGDPQ